MSKKTIGTAVVTMLTTVMYITDANAQDVRVEMRKGSDLCPELRVVNTGKKPATVNVEYDIVGVPAKPGRGGQRRDRLDAPIGSVIYPTNVMGVYCDQPYKFNFTYKVVSN